MTRLTLRIEFDEGRALGPGKIRLLEHLAETGSISAAGRAMGMSYRRAWLLIASLNQTFHDPAVETRGGGAGGGGATLTPFGQALVAGYRAMEQATATAIAGRLAMFEAALAPPPLPPLDSADRASMVRARQPGDDA